MKICTAMLVVAAAGSIASADRVATSANGIAVPANLQAISGVDRGVNFQENFESGFALGQLPPQGGWTSDFDANAVVSNVNPISGTSGRHMSDGTLVPGFEVRSPIVPIEFGSINADIRISGTTSLYQVATAGDEFLNTRVSFELSGDITVGQLNAAQSAFDFIDSGADWTAGETFNIGIGTASDGTLTVTMNGATIFTGTDTGFDFNGVGEGVSGWLVFSDNAGNGDADGNGDTLTFDNINIPAPGAIALAGLGGLAASRRRRA